MGDGYGSLSQCYSISAESHIREHQIDGWSRGFLVETIYPGVYLPFQTINSRCRSTFKSLQVQVNPTLLCSVPDLKRR
jgi:hypothetical protein